MNPWRKLFIDGDRMDPKGITPEQLKVGMSCDGVAYKLRHGLITVGVARATLVVRRDKCHKYLHPIIDRCLVEEPDVAQSWRPTPPAQHPTKGTP